MAGIYIHIPFCKQACSYCDFHFSTNLKNRSLIVKSILAELVLRKNYLEDEVIETIYFGGGTPSILNQLELEQIINQIHKQYKVSPNIEFCLEANPDDLNQVKTKELYTLGINRLSIGIQSFHDNDLQFMNRAHNSSEAINCIKTAQDTGIHNLSIDLIFGSPTTSLTMWEENLRLFFSLNIPHLSAYSLTVEEKTKLSHQIKTGQVVPLNDENSYRQYMLLQDQIDKNDFEQYELSNYCKDQLYSKHNSSYWKQINYLGIGPSSHSFNGKTRQWNVSNNALYIKAISEGKLNLEEEVLSEEDQYHDFLITRLRTKWGISIRELESLFSENIVTHFKSQIKSIDKGMIQYNQQSLIVNRSSLFQSDQVVETLWLG